MRAVFMGTPDFAAESLKAVYDSGFEIAGVFTQPDKPQGRKMILTPPPVKIMAADLGIPVYQPVSLKDPDTAESLRRLNPDIIIVVAYGKILPKAILDIPPLGCINVHASLLPKYRGAAPIQRAILNGDDITGVTTMYLSEKMDEGDIIYSDTAAVDLYDTSEMLFNRLSKAGADLLIRTLKDIEAGTAPRTSQKQEEATYASPLDKSISPIDFTKPARLVIKQIYGLQPWPVATMNLDGRDIKVFNAELSDIISSSKPGSIINADSKGIRIVCGDGLTVVLTEIQEAGRKRMLISDYLRGHPIKINE